MQSTNNTYSIGFGFLFSCGAIGIISLAVEIIRTPEALQKLELVEIVAPLAIGIFTSTGIVLANIAAGLGIAGISNSIIHTNLVLITVFNYFVLNQLLSFEQSIGIMLTVLGGLLLAIGEKIAACGKPSEEEEQPTVAAANFRGA
jgi:drug/metabolite transporter (DMT)-like permease